VDPGKIQRVLAAARRAIGACLLFTALCIAAPAPLLAGSPEQNPSDPKAEGSSWTVSIQWFQKTLSRADGSRCPMYPSCSHYSRQAFEHYNPLTAWMLTADRLLRCGRDETRLSKPVVVNNRIKSKDTLADNTFWWRTP
jgi:putative component of membrane protein insertase Oxa1/YidC/SpoIIIJ protein YidD